MDFRSQFIKHPNNGLIAIFNRIKMNPQPDDPIEINSFGVGLQDPVKIPENLRPAVFFGYGETRRLEGQSFSDYEGETFTVHIFAIVNKTANKDIIDRQGDMRSLMDRIVEEVRAIPVTDDIFLRNVVISRVDTDKGTLSDYAEMVFDLTYIYEYD